MTAERLEREHDSAQFSLAALLVVTTAVAALFAKAGVNAVLLLPVLLGAGLLIALGRLVEGYGWDGACLFLLRFVATGVLPFAGALAAATAFWFALFICSGLDALLASRNFRDIVPWFLLPTVAAMTWFVSSRRWAYRGCWAGPSVFLSFASLSWLSRAVGEAPVSPAELREAALAYAIAAGLFIAGFLGERRRGRSPPKSSRDLLPELSGNFVSGCIEPAAATLHPHSGG
jgi:hypothetical protein